MAKSLRVVGATLLVGLAAAPAASALTAPAASNFKLQPASKTELRLADIRDASCVDGLLPAGTKGVTTQRLVAPANGYLHTRLAGATTHAEDWDLALYDAQGRKRNASQGFSANEVATAYVRAGEVLTAQVCRRAGVDDTVRFSSQFTIISDKVFNAPRLRMQLVEVDMGRVGSRIAMAAMQAANLDVTEHVHGDEVHVLLYGAEDLRVLKALKLPFKVLVADMGKDFLSERKKEDAWRASLGGGRSALPSGSTGYRDLDKIQGELKGIVAKFPKDARPIKLPQLSRQGRTVEGIEVAKDVNREDDGRPVFFLMGNHHAREWPAAEAPLEFAYDLLQSNEPRFKAVLDKVRVLVVPNINPDAFVETKTTSVPDPEFQGDVGGGLYTAMALNGTGPYRRKNCFGVLPAAPCAAQYGVDPNRNYGEKWGGPGAGPNQDSQEHRGDGQWSEPETQNVHEYSQIRNVTTMISTHNVAALMLRPPGLKSEGLAPDEPALKALGDAVGKAAGYTSQYSWQLYDTSGTTEPWNYAAAGTYGYTVEMGPAGGRFHQAYEDGLVGDYEGKGKLKGKGLREGYLLTAEKAFDRSAFSTLKGRAPAGRILKVRKDFITLSSPVCTANNTTATRVIAEEGIIRDTIGCAAPMPAREFKDFLEYTTKVPANGNYDWLITQSSRPFELRKGKVEKWTLTCTNPDTKKVENTMEVEVGRGETRELDLPCGGTLPAKVGGSADKLAPVTKFVRKSLKATRKGISIQGTSKDRAPKGVTPQLKGVTVALGRRTGSRCQFLTAAGKLGPNTSCLRTRYIKAAGTSQWSFVLKRKLKPGKYLLYVRGTDIAGNTERKAKSKRNLITFTIR